MLKLLRKLFRSKVSHFALNWSKEEFRYQANKDNILRSCAIARSIPERPVSCSAKGPTSIALLIGSHFINPESFVITNESVS